VIPRARSLLASLAGTALVAALAACSGTETGVWDRPYVSAAASAPAPSLPPPRRLTPGDAGATRTTRAAPPATLAPPAATRVAPPAPASAASADDRATFEEVNRIRRARGLRPFRWNDRIHAAARDHSADQRRCGHMSHGSPDPRREDLKDRMRLAGWQGRQWAEVVAWGYKTPPAVVDGWMNSSGHRKILLDPALEEAGFARDGDYWTGDFGTPFR
jgi:uncharacterized protein YkwD